MGIAGAMPLLYGQGLWNLARARDSIPNTESTHLQGEIMTTQEYLKLFYKGNHPLQKRASGYFSRHIRFSAEAVGHALGEGWRSNGKMRAEDRLSTNELVGLSLGALIALDSVSEYERVLESTLGVHISAVEAREICYQATPYVGFARVSAFVERSLAIFEARGVALEAQDTAESTESMGGDSRDFSDSVEARRERGLEAQRAIFGEAIDKGNAAAPDDEKHIRGYLSSNCFGDYYTREGLSLGFRELLTFVFLSALGGAQPQLTAHASGNLRIGNSRTKLIAAVTALIPLVGYPRALNALSAIDEASGGK